MVCYIDLLHLLVGHVEGETIVLAAELQTAIDDGHVINIGEKPGFVSTIVVTAFFEDDSDPVLCPWEGGALLYGCLLMRIYCGSLL